MRVKIAVAVSMALLAGSTLAVAQSKPTSKPASKPKPTTQGVADGMEYVKVSTTLGDMVFELNAQKAPNTVKNFLGYVDSGFYDGTIFHRVIEDFMAQGGGFTAENIESAAARPKTPTQPAVKNEADNGLKNEFGTLAMARTGNPHSATSQFFINVQNNPHLNHRSKDARGWGYCVFGRVAAGFDTLEKIRKTKTKRLLAMQGAEVLPDPIITIEKVTRLKLEDAKKELDKKS